MRDGSYGRLERVLESMTFPAQRWQIVAEAGMRGADPELRTLANALPIRLYEDTADVIGALGSHAEGTY
jgi:hypothetical protein